MAPFLQALAASALSGVLVGFVAWYGNKKTSSFFYGQLTRQVDEHERRIGVNEADIKAHETRISHLEPKANGAAVGRFPN